MVTDKQHRKGWVEIAKAYAATAGSRTKKQRSISFFDLRYAVYQMFGIRAERKFGVVYEQFPECLFDRENCPMIASLMAAMSQKEYENFVEVEK